MKRPLTNAQRQHRFRQRREAEFIRLKAMAKAEIERRDARIAQLEAKLSIPISAVELPQIKKRRKRYDEMTEDEKIQYDLSFELDERLSRYRKQQRKRHGFRKDTDPKLDIDTTAYMVATEIGRNGRTLGKSSADRRQPRHHAPQRAPVPDQDAACSCRGMSQDLRGTRI